MKGKTEPYKRENKQKKTKMNENKTKQNKK